jgi:hypothetical protein
VGKMTKSESITNDERGSTSKHHDLSLVIRAS